MKIFILDVPEKLQPANQKDFRYPSHNKDYGVEQDFLIWLQKHPELLTTDPQAADWHYLPVFWTRWHINHRFAANGEGLEELENEVGKILISQSKTFTITQFDGGSLLTSNTLVEFTAARTTNLGIDIPILCSPHKIPIFPISKKYITSFNGSLYTHPVRQEMCDTLKDHNDILIGGNIPTRFYKRWLLGKQYNLNTIASYVALCPRGTSCSSFRFYEAMQFGVAPILIGDNDVRPFKKFIPWDDISYFAEDVTSLEVLLTNLDKTEALKKGKLAKKFWKNELYYQKWCKYVLKELNTIDK